MGRRTNTDNSKSVPVDSATSPELAARKSPKVTKNSKLGKAAPKTGVKSPVKETKTKLAKAELAKAELAKAKLAKAKLAKAKLAKAKSGTIKAKSAKSSITAEAAIPAVPAIMRPARKPTKKTPPSLKVEKAMWAQGHNVVVGIDEVGRGSWAGPLAIGAVVLPFDGRVNGVRDSKMLTEREREALFDRVAGWASHWAIGFVSHDECDEIGMSAAQKLAARRAIEGLGVDVDRVLIDGNWDFVSEFLGPGKTQRIIKGDATCLSIAAASVLAKVSRDRMMREWDESFPGFNFAENKGYPCPKHKMALQAYGPTSIHRRSWAFMDNMPWGIPRTIPRHMPGQESLF
jgi:ribonuclease HII